VGYTQEDTEIAEARKRLVALRLSGDEDMNMNDDITNKN
jgi:hypothetical protein